MKLRVGAKFTKLGDGPSRHFEVIAAGKEQARLRCIVTREELSVSLPALKDVSAWKPGWLRL